jgi:hypothetical protein
MAKAAQGDFSFGAEGVFDQEHGGVLGVKADQEVGAQAHGHRMAGVGQVEEFEALGHCVFQTGLGVWGRSWLAREKKG